VIANSEGHSWRLPLVALAALIAAVALAACGGGDVGGDDNGNGEVEVAEAEGEPSGRLNVSNWPFYIDRQTVPEFQDETGIQVNYNEDVDDNNNFFGAVQPQLEQGQSGGRDIMVVTDWMAKRMYDLGYLQNFDEEAVQPAMDSLREDLREPAFDPDRSYSLPWQSGMTGLVVNTAEAPDIESINDLFDPEYRGQVTMLSEMRDTVPLVMKADGVDPADATEDDWMAAIDKIRQASEDGQLRRFTGNEYTNDLAQGNAVASIGWSGDAVQLQDDNPDIEFVMPTEGCMLWSDNMVIPVGAPNPTAAYEWMRYVYEPDNQAQITDYNYYVSPVQGVQEVLEEEGSEAAESELVFPSEEYTANCSTQDEPSDDPEATERVEQEFQSVVTG
jgi:spermidine/putrescine transport system substrate-binding protein